MPIDFIADEEGIDFQPESGSVAPGIDFQEEAGPGVFGGAVNALRRGVSSAQAIAPTILAAGSPVGPPTTSQQRRGFEQALSDPLYMSESMNASASNDPQRLLAVEAERGPRAQAEAMGAQKQAIRDVWTGVVADMNAEREAIPKSAAQEELAQAKTTGDKWSVFRKYPGQVVSSIVLESLPPSLAGAVVGSAGGPAGVVAGVGLSSAAQEFSGTFLDEASKQGFDPQDQAQLAKFLESPGYEKALGKALTRASIVGGVDAATAGAAGRFIGPALKTGLKNVITATGKEIGQQAIGGAGGELAAQAATKGEDEPFDWFDVAMEGVAEIATGPAESFSNLRSETLENRRATIEKAAPKLVQAEAPVEKPAQITPDALAELEAAIRGNQVKPGAVFKQEPKMEPAPRSEPEVVVVEKEPEGEQVSEQDLANRKYVELADKRAEDFITSEGKPYEKYTDDELGMLGALGDQDARRETRRRRREKEAALKETEETPVIKEAEVDFQPEPEPARQEPEVLPESPPAPATITGHDEGKASEMPAEAGESPAPVQTPPKSRRFSNRPPDIIDAIEDTIGKIRSVSASTKENASLFEGWQELRRFGASRKVLSSANTAVSPDKALASLIEQRVLPEGATIDDLRDAILHAAQTRRGDRQTATREKNLLEVEEQQYENFQKTGLRRRLPGVPVTDLIAGDTFELAGSKVTVKDFDLDPDTHEVRAVILDDGRRFGTQRVGADEVIRPDKGSLKHPESVGFAPEEEEAPVPAKPAPSLKSGQNQGDLLGSGDVDFNLYSERTGDGEREATERAKAEQTKREAKEIQDKEQGGFEGFLDKLKIDTDQSQLHAFGLLPEVWNGLIEVVRATYRAGKSAAAAVEAGIKWLRENNGGKSFDESAVRRGLGRVLEQDAPEQSKADSIRARIRPIEQEMAGHEEAGREIPKELLETYKSMVDELGEEIRGGRHAMGARVDSDLEASEAPREGAKKPVPAFRGPARLPSGSLRDLWSGLVEWRTKIVEGWRRRPISQLLTWQRDSANNRADRLANQAANSVRRVLNRSFGETNTRAKGDLREAALTFAIEADNERGRLAEMHEDIAESEFGGTTSGKRALAAIEFANENWEKLQPAIEAFREISRIQRENELNSDVDSNEWQGGYIYHAWRGFETTAGDPSSPVGAGTPFRKRRSVPTYAEGIAAGHKPASLNAITLLSKRVQSGQRKLNELNWALALKDITDPVSGLPIAQSVEWKPRNPHRGSKGSEATDNWDQSAPAKWEPVAPPEYEVTKLGELIFALKRGYKPLFTDLTSPSWFRTGGGKAAIQKTFAVMKHVLLLFDTFHLGRLAAWATVMKGTPTYGKGATLLDYSEADIREMVKSGELPEKYAKDLSENVRLIDLALKTGFNVGQIQETLYNDWVHHLPLVGKFNQWLFGQYQRGAMAQSWLLEFNRLRRATPDATETEVARRVSWDLNKRFGSLGAQGLFRSKTSQDLARLFILAPQWNEGLIRSELGAYGQLAKAPFESIKQRRLVVGTLLKATGTMMLAQFVANQLINLATRGKPTWENEEEDPASKISAWIPDVVGHSGGYFLNPMAISAEYAHMLEGQIHRSEGPLDALNRILQGRVSAPMRSGLIFMTRKDPLGRSLREGEVLPAMTKALIPVPIAVPALGSAAKQLVTGEPSEQFAGQFQKQALSTFGIKADKAPDAEQRIRSLAKEFNRAKGIIPNAQFYAGDFTEFTAALHRGNKTDAADALEELLKKKTAAQVAEHYSRWVVAPFTGQKGREGQFWRDLTEEQRQKYQEARAARRQLAIEARRMLREAVKR